ncbi:MAG: hypothetical protein AB1762_17970, partial [Gemmatimonadota bacterium]
APIVFGAQRAPQWRVSAMRPPLARSLSAVVKIALVYFAARGVLTMFGVDSHWLPLGISLTALVVGRFFVVRAFLRGLRQLVLTKSDALRSAAVTVHAVTPAHTPADFVAQAGINPLFYSIDVTIEPRQVDAQWDADDIVLVDAGVAAPRRDPQAFETKHDTAYAYGLEVFDGDRFAAGTNNKMLGRQRIRLLMAVEKRVPRVKIKYYFEHLEPAFDLPPHQLSAAA